MSIKMNKFFISIILNILVINNAFAATVNCTNGKCEFINSIHYKVATTYCMQTLSFEEVETDFTSFTIIKTGELCQIIDSET